MLDLARELFDVLNISGSVKLIHDITVFDLAHKLGLSPKQQYELLQLERESDRQLYVIEHLEKTIPLMQEMERAKDRIRMNGHFRKFDPLDF